jgi:hypothetical protein
MLTSAPSLPQALSACRNQLTAKQTAETPVHQLRALQTATLLCDIFGQTAAQQSVNAEPADLLGAALWLANWYAATAAHAAQPSSLILSPDADTTTRPVRRDVAQGFTDLAEAWRLLAQALAEVLPGETVTATVPGALRIWTVVTASLVAAATSGTDRRQVMILTTLLRQISGEAATLAMGYGQSEGEAAEEADPSGSERA